MSAARTAVVTGAASGIGSEVADRFPANGDTVAAADLSQETSGACHTRRGTDPTAPENQSLHTLTMNVSSQTSAAALTDHARQQAQAVGVLIDCAGHFSQITSEQMSIEEWRRVTDINHTGGFLMIQAFLPLPKATHAAASSTSGPAVRHNATRLPATAT